MTITYTYLYMKRFHYFLFICFGLVGLPATMLQAQSTQRPHGRSVEIFPYPYARMFYLQPRFDRVNYNDGTYLDSYVVRAFSTYGNNWHFRAEIPLADTDKPGHHVFGLADINLRAVHAHRLHDKLFLGYGMQLDMNTATDASLGGGKWDLRPGIGLVYFRGTPDDVTGTTLLSLEYRTTIAKEAGRTRTNVLALAPNIDWWFKHWYIGYYATWTYDFENDVLDIPVDVEAGYSITPKLTLSGELILPLTSKVAYKNEFAVKVRYMF